MRGIVRGILRKACPSQSSSSEPDQSGGQATAAEIQARTEQTGRTRARKNLHHLNVLFPELARTDPKAEAATIGPL